MICHGEEIKIKEVKKELYYNDNIVYVPVKVLVCQACGERYYDRRTMRFLEEVEKKLKTETVKLKEVGKLLMYG